MDIYDLCSIRDRLNARRICSMNHDRIAGAAKEAKGAIKEAAGKILGDAKLVADGKVEIAEGKAQNAIGGVKDSAKEILPK